MAETEKVYYNDVFARTLETRVAAVDAAGRRVSLEATVFYPEGGGQPADCGTLTFAGCIAVKVTDVHEADGIVWHTLDTLPEGLAPGCTAACEIDWARRFDHMQQHSGEHILSGILHGLFGAENVGFHIGADAVRMDTNVPISSAQLREAELAANRIVWADAPVVITWPTADELAALTYRSKKELTGAVRIVEFPGADVCACCGTHVARAGQAGQIKILTAENYKGGSRLSVVCGARALAAAEGMRARQADIGALLSAKADKTAEAVHRVYAEYTALKFAHYGMAAQLFAALAAAAKPGVPAIRALPALTPDELHRLADSLATATGAVCAALTDTPNGAGWCIACAACAGGAPAAPITDVRPLAKRLAAAFGARGGGKPGCCQGSCPGKTAKELAEYLNMQPEFSTADTPSC